MLEISVFNNSSVEGVGAAVNFVAQPDDAMFPYVGLDQFECLSACGPVIFRTDNSNIEEAALLPSIPGYMTRLSSSRSPEASMAPLII